MEFKYKQTYLIYSDIYEHAVYLVCGGGPHFSGNLMQSYIRTCIIWCVVGAPILVGTSCNHTSEHALFGVWWGLPFQWEHHAIIHSNMHYLVCGGGPWPYFSVNLMQSYIRTCTISCVVGAPILVETSCNHTFKHALYLQGQIYHGANGVAASSPHQNRGPTKRIEKAMFILWTCYFFVLILNGI